MIGIVFVRSGGEHENIYDIRRLDSGGRRRGAYEVC